LPHMLTMVSLCGDRVKICVLTICFAYFRCIPLWWRDFRNETVGTVGQ
jgi:hypothetical protein